MEMTWYPIIGLVCFLLGIGFTLLVLGERAIADAPQEPVQEQKPVQSQCERDIDEVARQAWGKWK